MNKTDTHSAEYFLQLIKRQRRGKFKIYIGMIAGVGKSYRMLCDAHEMQLVEEWMCRLVISKHMADRERRL